MEEPKGPVRRQVATRGGGFLVAGAVAFLTLTSPREIAGESGSPAPASGNEPGRLHGSVVIGPQLNARKIRFSLYPDVSAAAPPTAFSAEQEIRNVVVYIDSPDLPAGGVPDPGGSSGAGSSSSGGPPRIEQRNETFVPHVLPVMKGSPVEFTNDDPIYHNVFSLSKAASFDLGRYPRGASRSVRFGAPGIVKVFCHIHSDMSAVVLVLDNSYFTTPRTDGTFEIRGIPPGTYAVTAWHERAHAVHHKVTILPGRTTEMNFSIPLEDTASQ
jgi:plastocyanin